MLDYRSPIKFYLKSIAILAGEMTQVEGLERMIPDNMKKDIYYLDDKISEIHELVEESKRVKEKGQ